MRLYNVFSTLGNKNTCHLFSIKVTQLLYAYSKIHKENRTASSQNTKCTMKIIKNYKTSEKGSFMLELSGKSLRERWNLN